MGEWPGARGNHSSVRMLLGMVVARASHGSSVSSSRELVMWSDPHHLRVFETCSSAETPSTVECRTRLRSRLIAAIATKQQRNHTALYQSQVVVWSRPVVADGICTKRKVVKSVPWVGFAPAIVMTHESELVCSSKQKPAESQATWTPAFSVSGSGKGHMKIHGRSTLHANDAWVSPRPLQFEHLLLKQELENERSELADVRRHLEWEHSLFARGQSLLLLLAAFACMICVSFGSCEIAVQPRGMQSKWSRRFEFQSPDKLQWMVNFYFSCSDGGEKNSSIEVSEEIGKTDSTIDVAQHEIVDAFISEHRLENKEHRDITENGGVDDAPDLLKMETQAPNQAHSSSQFEQNQSSSQAPEIVEQCEHSDEDETIESKSAADDADEGSPLPETPDENLTTQSDECHSESPLDEDEDENEDEGSSGENDADDGDHSCGTSDGYEKLEIGDSFYLE